MLRPLYLFLVNHDLLNKQPQQFRRQLRDIRIPVSYTHLDVYKRQKWGDPKALCQKYMDHQHKEANIILTQRVRLGMDGYKTPVSYTHLRHSEGIPTVPAGAG